MQHTYDIGIYTYCYRNIYIRVKTIMYSKITNRRINYV